MSSTIVAHPYSSTSTSQRVHNDRSSKLSATARHILPPCPLQRKIYWHLVNKLNCDPSPSTPHAHLGNFIPGTVELFSGSDKTLRYTLIILESIERVMKLPGASQKAFLQAFQLARKLVSSDESEESNHNGFEERQSKTCDTIESCSPAETYIPCDRGASEEYGDSRQNNQVGLFSPAEIYTSCDRESEDCNESQQNNPVAVCSPAATYVSCDRGAEEYSDSEQSDQQPYVEHNNPSWNTPAFQWNPHTQSYYSPYAYSQGGYGDISASRYLAPYGY